MAGGGRLLSPYEYRLGELLPVLREIAPNEAKDLEKEHPKVKAGLEAFGQQRFDHPEPIERRAQAPGEEIRAEPAPPRTSNRPGVSQDRGSEAATRARVNEQSAARARFALDRASRLPSLARAKALEGVAVRNHTSDPTDAARALEELANTVDELPLNDRPHYLESAAELYLAMNNRDAGLKVIDRGLDTALKIYTQDSSSSELDRVPKALWPSTRFWEKLIHQAAEVAPDRGRQGLEAIPDNAIRLIEQVEFTTIMLGTPAVSQSDEAPRQKPLNSRLSKGDKPLF